MKSISIRAAACTLVLITLHHLTHTTILVRGNSGNTSATFLATTPVLAKVYDHPTASFIVSTVTPQNGTNDYALATATGTFGANIPSFAPIAPAFAETQSATMLALATSYGSTNPNLAFVMSSTPPPTITLTANVNILSLNSLGTTFAQSNPLLDASTAGQINVPGKQTAGITSIAANASFIFAAVEPNSTVMPTMFGTPGGSGIAVVSIAPTTLALTQVPAIAGDGGIKAAPFDNTNPAAVFTGAVIINPNNLPNNAAFPSVLTYPAMIWDDQLQRLYIGYDLETDNMGSISGFTSPASGGLSVAAAYLTNPSGTIAFLPMAPGGAFIPHKQDNIIGVLLDEYCAEEICYQPYYPFFCNPSEMDPNAPDYCSYPPECYPPYCPELNLAVYRLAVLHASTGPSYLIVNGGNGPRGTNGNLIFALPLVDNPSVPSTHGTFANKNSALVNGKFVVPAVTNADLATSHDQAAVVGAGPFPIQGADTIADLVVVGDTVYASSSQPLSSVTESGIFYSQAMFDATGKIIRWTPWTKRSFPYTGFPNNSPQASFFAVDASTGDVWAVDGVTKTQVMVTAWDKGQAPSLVAQVNQNLLSNPCSNTCYSGCFSVLDLDQSTRGFLNNTCSRYALFGGINKVIFAQVSQSLSPYCAEYPNDNVLSPQQVMTDYTQPQNLLSTSLLECGAVTVLEYSRKGDLNAIPTEPLGNYFYAGTQNGLYVFADPQGNAINVNTFDNVNEPPFSNGIWFKAPNINGAVIDIKTTGTMLYVLTVNSTPAAPLQGTLYRIPFASTINTMFTTSNIIPIAQTMTSPIFNSVLRFTGVQIISTSGNGSTEQLVLATNKGLYQSAKIGGVQSAANQTDANWQLVSNSGTNFYLGIGGMHSSAPIASPSTVWPFNLQDPTGLRIFNRGRIYQLNGNSDSVPFNFVPLFFNSINSATNPNFATLDPITYFWSDGGRRFFITNPPATQGCADTASNTLFVLPFDTIDWNISQPDQDFDLDPTLQTVQSFNWVQDIGATGIVMAGTNKGVVGLE